MMPYEMVNKTDKAAAENKPDADTFSPNIPNENKALIEGKVKEGNVQKNKNFIKDRVRLRLVNILKTVTRIASINGYDTRRHIRGKNGKYILNTDVVELILHAMQPAKVVHGEEEFISLLREARVDPEWLFNENLKTKLLPNTAYQSEENTSQPSIEQPMYVEKSEPLSSKRKREKEEEDIPEASKKRKIDWEYSDDE